MYDIRDSLISAISELKTSFTAYLKSIDTNVSSFLIKFDTYSANVLKQLDYFYQFINELLNATYQIRDRLKNIEKYYFANYTDNGTEGRYYYLQNGWKGFYGAFANKDFTEVLSDTLLDVHQKIEDTVNPVSDNNKDNFNAALSNLNDNTFIGSANEMVTTFPEQLKVALSKDSSPVLQFKTYGVSNSYFSLPGKTYSIDFSWYAPFKGTADTVISAFMYLGFLFIFFKRLPEILHGAGVMRDNYNDFQEARDFNYNENLFDPPETYEFYYNGQWREGE